MTRQSTAPASERPGQTMEKAPNDKTVPILADSGSSVKQLLNHLTRGGNWSYYWTNPGKLSTWWETGAPAPLPDPSKHNVYFGVHPTAERRQSNQRARIEDIAAINCLFADFDTECGTESEKSALLEYVNNLNPIPSVVVDSGGGLHCYWLLNAPYPLTADNKRERAKMLQRRWVELVAADNGSKDLAHILRVPGTLNRKYNPPRGVRIIKANLEQSYTLDYLETLLPSKERSAPAMPAVSRDGPDPYAQAVFEGELGRLAMTQEGSKKRNITLNNAAFRLGQFCATGRLDRGEVERQLLSTALSTGLPERDSRATIRSGLDAGMQNPTADGLPERRQKHVPIGKPIPRERAEEIKTLAPPPPDPDFREQIVKALRQLTQDGKKRLPADIRRENAGRLLLSWLAENGGITQAGGEQFYFHRPSRQLFNLNSNRWAAWLYSATGANPAGRDFAHLKADCETAAMTAPTREIVKVAAWDSTAQVLRVSRFDGTVYVLDGDTIQEEANGEAVLFDDDPAWIPYQPDGDGTALQWHTTQLPNWRENSAAHGLALRAWILSTFLTELCPTRPMAAIIGEKGAGKTMVWRLLLHFLFGTNTEVSGVPDKPDGFTAAAAAAHVLVLDNLDTFQGWLRDKLARLATGGVDEYRLLYSNNEVGRVRYRCWLAFTSRTPATLRRDDLADRLLLLPVERIQPEALRAEREFLSQGDTLRNAWWGNVLTTLNNVVAAIRRGELESKSTLRMADWESLGRLIAREENAEEIWNSFIKQLTRAQSDFLLEDDLIVEGLSVWMDNTANHGREVTSRILHQELTAILFGDRKPPQDWPKSTVGFGKQLAGIRRELRKLYQGEWNEGTKAATRGRKTYRFWSLGEGQQSLFPEDKED